MIPQIIIDQVRELLASGKYTQRQISRMTGVSRGTVCGIHSGRRQDVRPQRNDAQSLTLHSLPIVPRRCPGCGGMVNLWPCPLCHVRRCRRQVAALPAARRPHRQAG